MLLRHTLEARSERALSLFAERQKALVELGSLRTRDRAEDGALAGWAAAGLMQSAPSIVLKSLESQRAPERSVSLECEMGCFPLSSARAMAEGCELKRCGAHEAIL